MPSWRTLRRKIEQIKFYPGMLHEIFYYLNLKVTDFNDYEKDCLHLDERALTPGKQYYTVSSTILEYETLEKFSEIATHSLVIMIGGILRRWKQVISYQEIPQVDSHWEITLRINNVIGYNAIKWLKTIKDPTAKLARWSIKLSEFDYPVVHKSENKHKDSRLVESSDSGKAVT